MQLLQNSLSFPEDLFGFRNAVIHECMTSVGTDLSTSVSQIRLIYAVKGSFTDVLTHVFPCVRVLIIRRPPAKPSRNGAPIDSRGVSKLRICLDFPLYGAGSRP